MDLVGHRGCSDHGPENTVEAVTAAARRLPGVEIDLRRCASGELVAVHDERVDDVTDGTGRVADLDLAALRELRVQGSDEGVATFAEILDAVPDDVALHVELKETGLHADVRRALAEHDRPSGDRDDGAAASGDGAAASGDAERGSSVRITSFSAPALAEIARSDWRPEAGIIFGETPSANLDLAAVLDCENVHPHATHCLETDVVDVAHDRGFGVYAWGLEDAAGEASERAATVRALAERGVDGVTTDTWDLPTDL